MEGGLMYDIMAWLFLVCIGIYHIYSATVNYLSAPNSYIYSAKPYHPLSSSSSSYWIRHFELYLVIFCLIIALIHQLILSSKSGIHVFPSLRSASVIFLFLLLSLSLLLSDTTSLLPLSPDLVFALASAAFYLHSSSVSSSSSGLGLQSECHSLSARVSTLSSLLCLALSCFPRLYVAEVGLGASICLQGQWALQTGLSLHVDALIPLGCHKLLDVVQGSTKCDLDESNIRAVALLDLMFVVHVVVVVLVVIFIYAVVARKNNVTRRFVGSYESLPTATAPTAAGIGNGNVTAADSTHIQMKAMTGTQA